MTLELTYAEAVVLFEFLNRFTDEERLAIEDQSERRVLWDINARLEPKIDEVFNPDYNQVVKQAQEEVRNPKE